MRKKNTSIPVNSIVNEFGAGIAIERTSFKSLPSFKEAEQSHREDRHTFFLLEAGTVHVEIDFQTHIIKPACVIYMHPSQVHRIIALKEVIISTWAVNNENLNPDYLKLVERITPARPLALDKETFSLITDAITLCLKFSERKNDKLYHSLLKDGCNILVGLVASQYLEHATSSNRPSRFERVTKAFMNLLEQTYTTAKRPTDYAQKLNVSTPYLNECVKYTTGYSVSYHIQQRIILESKRLLYHSDKSIKEIATAVGYDDYPYFSRLFTKVAGMTALAFRDKNRD